MRLSLYAIMITAASLIATGPAPAASPIRGRSYHSSAWNTTATVDATGKTMGVFFQPKCSGARFDTVLGFRLARKVKIKHGGAFYYNGPITSVPKSSSAPSPTIRLKGTAKMTGKFVTRQKMTAKLKFTTSGCNGKKNMRLTALASFY